MDQQAALESLKYYLSSRDAFQVVALKGSWGGGKTHVWLKTEQHLATNQKQGEATPLYASLFGVETVEELKKRLFSAELDKAVPGSPAVLDSMKKALSKVPDAVGALSKLAESVLNVAGSITASVGEVIVDNTLRERLIVLDDIERRGSTLSVVNVLGFIDFLRARGCRVLVIFNEEKIGDEDEIEALATFREKAFDIEMHLEVTPSEAFEIALGRNSDTPHVEKLRSSCVKLGVANIRVIARILAAAKHVLSDASIDDELIEESAPAVAVVTAIFYGAVAGAPTLLALDQSYGNTKSRPFVSAKSVGGLAVLDESESGFRRYHMPLADRRLVHLLVEHVKTGNLLTREFSDFWVAATQDLLQRRAMYTFEKWLEDVEWAPYGTPENLINGATENQSMLVHLDDATRKRVTTELRELGAVELANEFLLDLGQSQQRGDSCGALARREQESFEPAGTQARRLIHDVQASRDLPIDIATRLNRCSVEDFAVVLSTDKTDEFKKCVSLLLILRDRDIRFNAKHLGQALHQVFERDTSKRREQVMRAQMPGADNALDRVLAVGRGEPSAGWPLRDQIPS